MKPDLDTLAKHTPALLCTASPSGRFEWVSPRWPRFLGRPMDDILHQPFMSFVHADDKARTGRVMSRLLAGATVEGFSNRYRCIGHNGEECYRTVIWHAGPGPEGDIYAVAFPAREMAENIADALADRPTGSLTEDTRRLQARLHRLAQRLAELAEASDA